MSTMTTYSPEEVGRLGEAIYQERLRSLVEPDYFGKFISIDVETGSYEIGDDRLDNTHRIRAKNPSAVIYTVKIGCPAVVAIGATLRPNNPPTVGAYQT
ncbi:MAG: hypothetical protein ACLQVD_14765 [Capsulimonadaceae bacterium]